MLPLCGSAQANAATIIAIPANRVWRGTIAVSLRDVGPGEAEISLQGGGTGVAPAAGTVVLRVHCNGDSQALSSELTVITGNAEATLRFNTNSTEEATGMANGILTKPGV